MPKTEVTTTRVVWDNPALSGVSFTFFRDKNGKVDEVRLGTTDVTISVANYALFVSLVLAVEADL